MYIIYTYVCIIGNTDIILEKGIKLSIGEEFTNLS